MIWLILVIIIYLFLIAPSFEQPKLKQQKYAHRGFYTSDQLVQENSLAAFERAVEKGYGIELDVQLSKDGQVVVYHDENLYRLHHDRRAVSDCTYEELQAYQLPLLTDVLAVVDGKVDLIVELKTVPVAQIDRFCQVVYNILKNYQGTFSIESFHPLILNWFKKNAAEVTRGQLVAPVKQYPNVLLGLIINSFLYQAFTRPHFIAFEVSTTRWNPALWINKLTGAKFVLWTVRSPQEAQRKNLDAYIFEHYDA